MFNKKTVSTDLTVALDTQEIIWKILILDVRSTAIVSSVLRVNDLLKSGITVHALIKQDRSSLPDVPAIYFVQPTQENIDIIVNDLRNDKYLEFYINFTSSLTRDLLEDFAKKASTTGKSNRIKQVYDQYLDFVVTEPELFSLELTGAYSKLNSPQTSEDEINELCNIISEGLYNSIVTIGTVPIIRAPKGGPAEVVAQKLEGKLRDYIINTRSGHSNNSLERFVLVILDRNVDFASMFSHSWIYQCLVFDVFKLSRNTITIPTSDHNEESTKKMDIDPNDFFWASNAHLPFPDAVENVEEALATYKSEAEEITKRTGVNNLNELDSASQVDTLPIHEVVNKLPELTARKAIIDMHMNVLASLLKQLESRGLDAFFEIEQSQDSLKTRQRFLDTLKDERSNNFEDKLRTFIIMYLSSMSDLPKDFVSQVEEYFKESNYDISSLRYIYKLREIMKLSNMSLQNKPLETGSHDHHISSTGVSSSQLLSGLSSKLYGLTEGKIQGGVGSLISGIKNFLPEKKTIPITNILEAIMDPLNSSQNNLETTDDYLYFDPKIIKGAHSKKPKRQSYNKSLVFVVGGGNYLEYQNLQEWVHQQKGSPKNVIYGSTSIITPSEFLTEVANLG